VARWHQFILQTGANEIILSIIIVNYRTPEMARDAASSAIASGLDVGFEIIIVDNLSGDNSVQYLEDAFRDEPRVKIIASEKNLGFAGGNNLGFEYANGSIILLLNPDTYVEPGALNRLMDTLKSADDIAVVGGMLVDAESKPVTSYGFFPTPLSMITAAFLPGKFYGKARRTLGVAPPLGETEPYEVDYICGAGLMIRRDVLDDIGGMDDGYFMYFEETDLCRQVQGKGFRVIYNPMACIKHFEGASFGDAYTRRRIMFMKSSVRFFRKNGYSSLFMGMYHIATFVSSLIKLVYFWLRYAILPARREETSKHIAWNRFIFPYYLGIGRKRWAG
jgi:N-acetylglucosaminyl-diphospho-decaprenol L-rhamnosyltransferase